LLQIIDDATEPKYTREQLEAASERLILADVLADEVTCPDCGSNFVPGKGHVHLPDGPDLGRDIIREGMQRLEKQEAAKLARVQLMALATIDKPLDNLDATRDAILAWQAYDKQVADIETRMKLNAEVERELYMLDVPSDEDLNYLRDRLSDSQMYERDYTNYIKLQERFDNLSAEIAELSKRAKAFKEGHTELVNARASIKSYLSPAISAAASNIMHQMTNGKHSVVTVDEDMDVTVGTQPLNTLSGGAATIANLALRLALGQVLVSETFPVFFGDEMDSDADGERRETVVEAMQSLVKRGLLKQVVLITHRGVDIADHVYDLGKNA
jgi:DNA repair exonuclease SbcCD ATPase subunit